MRYPSIEQLLRRVERLNQIGIALSAERNLDRLLERIVEGAKEITCADGGTLYTLDNDGALKFEILRSDSLGLVLGGTSGKPVPYSPLALYDASGEPNLHHVAAYAAIKKRTVNIEDAYTATDFDFRGTKAFDLRTGYRSRSFLTVPLANHENELIGVLQLINATAPHSRRVVPFDPQSQHLVESLASQAAVAISNHQLIDAQRKLFEAFIQLIASAIDEKSPYTGKHCERVPILTMMMAEAASGAREGPLAGFHMSPEDLYELRIAAWLHDCGKVAIPEYVIDKATKLQTIFDRIHLIDARFAILKRDARIRMLENRLENRSPEAFSAAEEQYRAVLSELSAERDFLRRANIGSEFMSEKDRERVTRIGERRWIDPDDQYTPLLSADEIHNLTVVRGTLTAEERAVINNHIAVTIRMLESLPYPRDLVRVPEYAAGHHERMDGRGYPRGLTREQMSIPARMMGIADIFEALTAGDRPYKKGKTLSECLEILGHMKLDGHVDPDLFDLFIRSGIYRRYAQKFLLPEQIDNVDEARIPGYAP